MKDFISFLAGAIFVEELFAEDASPSPPPDAAPDNSPPSTSEPADGTDDQ